MPTYERYSAQSESRFGPFPKIRGLDGAKVGVLLEPDGAAELERSVRLLEEQGRSVDAITGLSAWWQSTGQPNASVDEGPVSEARIFGGRMALKWTAVVPALLAVGYLILLLYFRARGGYRQVELNEGGDSSQ